MSSAKSSRNKLAAWQTYLARKGLIGRMSDSPGMQSVSGRARQNERVKKEKKKT